MMLRTYVVKQTFSVGEFLIRFMSFETVTSPPAEVEGRVIRFHAINVINLGAWVSQKRFWDLRRTDTAVQASFFR